MKLQRGFTKNDSRKLGVVVVNKLAMDKGPQYLNIGAQYRHNGKTYHLSVLAVNLQVLASGRHLLQIPTIRISASMEASFASFLLACGCQLRALSAEAYCEIRRMATISRAYQVQ